MSDHPSTAPAPQKADPGPIAATAEKSAAVASPSPVAVENLTPEEQMALFEKSLKEEDWGHQPC